MRGPNGDDTQGSRTGESKGGGDDAATPAEVANMPVASNTAVASNVRWVPNVSVPALNYKQPEASRQGGPMSNQLRVQFGKQRVIMALSSGGCLRPAGGSHRLLFITALKRL